MIAQPAADARQRPRLDALGGQHRLLALDFGHGVGVERVVFALKLTVDHGEKGLADFSLIGPLQRLAVVHKIVARVGGNQDEVGLVLVAFLLQPDQLLIVAPAAHARVDRLHAQVALRLHQRGQPLWKALRPLDLAGLDKRIAQHQHAVDARGLFIAHGFGHAQPAAVD